MLSEVQYIFLTEFMKKAKEFKNQDDTLKHLNREKMDVGTLKDLFILHSELFPAEQYNEENPDDKLDGYMLLEFIKRYIKKVGLDECIEYFEPYYFGISANGLEKISEYKRNVSTLETAREANKIANKANSISLESNGISKEANEKSKSANKIAIIALVFSILATITGLVTLILEIIKFVLEK